jgi:hypothetical protein
LYDLGRVFLLVSLFFFWMEGAFSFLLAGCCGCCTEKMMAFLGCLIVWYLGEGWGLLI